MDTCTNHCDNGVIIFRDESSNVLDSHACTTCTTDAQKPKRRDMLAAEMGLRLERAEWGAVNIVDKSGSILATVGTVEAVPWMLGYKAAQAAAVALLEARMNECEGHSPQAASTFSAAADEVRYLLK